MKFSKQLWHFREKNGLTQKAASDVLEVKQKTFESWEHGRYEPQPIVKAVILERIKSYKIGDSS